MAKGKHAAALFEMMGRGPASDPGTSPTATPKWWTRRPAPPSDPAAPQAPVMQIDRDHHQITFSISTASAITVAFGVLVVIGIAFILGEHVGRRQGPMTAITSEDLLRSSPNPQVMQVQPGVNGPAHTDETAQPDTGEQPANNPTAAQQPTNQTPTPPQSADRQPGLNYVIMQSYPPDMHASAVEAQTVLLLHGIPCTIESIPARLRRSAKGWVSVIGTTGFKSTAAPEFKTYVQNIDAANADLHGKFKRLQPIPYKWP